MKHKLLLLSLSMYCLQAQAQITITASDMPVSGDTLRYSMANPLTSSFNAADSGVSKTWDFSTLTPIAQAVDTFKSALAVSPLYALTISPSAYGYKVADSMPGLGTALPITISEVYNFFNKKTSPSRFVVEGFAAIISSIPTPVNYSDEDEWYIFPLTYSNYDSSAFKLSFSLPSLGDLKMSGTRKTRADGWGTVVTPFLTTPTPCLRVRSEVDEIDSIVVATIGTGIPRKTVEYKFLVNGQHYPAVWVTANVLAGTETVTSIRYRDSARDLSNTNIATSPITLGSIKCYPNPVNNTLLNVDVPNEWHTFNIGLYDIKGKLVLSTQNTKIIDMTGVPKGSYFVQVVHGNSVLYAHVVN